METVQFWIRLQVKSRYNNAKCHTLSHHTTALKNDFMRRSECKDEKNVSSCALMGNSIFVILKKCQILNTIFPGINAAALINFLDVSTRRLFGDGACVRKYIEIYRNWSIVIHYFLHFNVQVFRGLPWPLGARPILSFEPGTMETRIIRWSHKTAHLWHHQSLIF